MLPKARKYGSISERSSRLLFDRVCRVAVFTWLLGILLMCVLTSPFQLYKPAAALTRLFQRADSIKFNESIAVSIAVSIDDTTTNEYTRANASDTMQVNQSVGTLTYPNTTPAHWPSDKPFNPDTQTLRDFLDGRAIDGTIVVCVFNFGYTMMLLNMLCRLNQLGIENYVIVAVDAEAWSWCRSMSLPCMPVSGNMTARASEPSVIGTTGFRAIAQAKPVAVLSVLSLGYDVLLSDVDVFFKANPLKRLRKLNESYDLIIQSDEAHDRERVTPDNIYGLNSGFYLMRSSNATVAALTSAIKELGAHEWRGDQQSFHFVFCGPAGEYITSESTCFNPEYRVLTRILSRAQWPNGDQTAMKENAIKAKTADDVIIAHFNWIVGKDAKENSMRRSDMWLLDLEGQCPYVEDLRRS